MITEKHEINKTTCESGLRRIIHTLYLMFIYSYISFIVHWFKYIPKPESYLCLKMLSYSVQSDVSVRVLCVIITSTLKF